MIDRLERDGLVQRIRDTVDRRRVVVTADAERLWQYVGPKYASVAQQWNGYLDTLTNDQIAFASTLLLRASEINAEQIEWLRGTDGP